MPRPIPTACVALRSVFLGTGEELDWAFDVGLRTFFPAHHRGLYSLSASAEDPLAAIWQAILHPDPVVYRTAALAFYRAERAMPDLHPSPDLPPLAPDTVLPAMPFTEAHYFTNDCILAQDQLIRDTGRLVRKRPAALPCCG